MTKQTVSTADVKMCAFDNKLVDLGGGVTKEYEFIIRDVEKKEVVSQKEEHEGKTFVIYNFNLDFRRDVEENEEATSHFPLNFVSLFIGTETPEGNQIDFKLINRLYEVAGLDPNVTKSKELLETLKGMPIRAKLKVKPPYNGGSYAQYSLVGNSLKESKYPDISDEALLTWEDIRQAEQEAEIEKLKEATPQFDY